MKPKLKNYMVMLHVSKVVQYYPLSKKNMKSAERTQKIDELAEKYNASADDVVMAIAYYLATVLRDRIKNSIKTQRINKKPMKSLYQPLSKDYQKQKRPQNRNKFWINEGDLYRDIKVWKYSKKVFVGIKDKHGANILFWNEQGTRNAPARPIVVPNVRTIARNINDYFDRFVELVEEDIIRIKPFKMNYNKMNNMKDFKF